MRLHSEEAIFLTKFASSVTLIVRRDVLRASKIMSDRVLQHPKIKVLWNTRPVSAEGAGELLDTVMGMVIDHPLSRVLMVLNKDVF